MDTAIKALAEMGVAEKSINKESFFLDLEAKEENLKPKENYRPNSQGKSK
jgi:hypothetical protein